MYIDKLCHPGIKYIFVKKFGDGSASKIFLATNKFTNDKVIIKRINKKEEWKSELRILKHVTKSPSKRLLKYVDSYETDRYVYIVTKMYEGFDLFDHIDINVPYPLKYAKILIKEMAKCIKDCHKMNVAHLDIKCENFMSICMEPTPELILLDFGHAEIVDDHNQRMGYSKYGTSFYLCPEGYDCIYSRKSDIWSLGVCAHLIITGDYPYKGVEKDYIKNIKLGKYSFHKQLNTESIEFLENCLNPNPSERYSVDDVLQSPFLR